MITSDEYRADFFKIAGFALMTPAGKFILELGSLSLNSLCFMFWINLIVAVILFFLGIMSMQRGYEIIVRKEWENK